MTKNIRRLVKEYKEFKIKIKRNFPKLQGMTFLVDKEIIIESSRDATEAEIVACLLHEVGHLKTWKKQYTTEVMLLNIGGRVSKGILRCELRASAWALRKIKREYPELYAEARQELLRSYGTYRRGYTNDIYTSKR